MFAFTFVALSLSISIVSGEYTSCPDYVKSKVAGGTCKADWECISLCCTEDLCINPSNCRKTVKDVCPAREPKPVSTDDSDKKERQKILMAVLIPFAYCCCCCVLAAICTGFGIKKYKEEEIKKRESKLIINHGVTTPRDAKDSKAPESQIEKIEKDQGDNEVEQLSPQKAEQVE